MRLECQEASRSRNRGKDKGERRRPRELKDRGCVLSVRMQIRDGRERMMKSGTVQDTKLIVEMKGDAPVFQFGRSKNDNDSKSRKEDDSFLIFLTV